ILAEMVVLPRHRAEPAHLPEEPLQDLDTAAQICRDEAASLFREVQQDRAGLEDRDGRTAALWLAVDDGRNAIVRRYGQKLGLELLARADLHGHDRVGKPRLFQKH